MNTDRAEYDETATERTPSLVDFVVFAPIGFVLKASTVVPELIQAGRAEYRKQAVVARLLGKMVVDQQRRKRQRPAVRPAPHPTVVETDEATAYPPTAAPLDLDSAPSTSPLAAELPIDGYDTLAARSILTLIEGLAPADLDRIETYERTHRQRATVLHRITQIRQGR
jgi:hypothetical protein